MSIFLLSSLIQQQLSLSPDTYIHICRHYTHAYTHTLHYTMLCVNMFSLIQKCLCLFLGIRWTMIQPWTVYFNCCSLVVGIGLYYSATFPMHTCRTTSPSTEMLSHGTRSERVVIKSLPGTSLASCSNQLKDSLLQWIRENYVCKRYCSHQWQRHSLVQVDEIQIQIVSTNTHTTYNMKEMLHDYISSL